MNRTITPYQSKYFAWLLSRQAGAGSPDLLATTLVDAQIELNPHQVEAALFAFENPLSTDRWGNLVINSAYDPQTLATTMCKPVKAGCEVGILDAPRGEFVAPKILDAARRESSRIDDWQPGSLHPNLAWTHYRTLLRITRPEARAFYEIESIRNAWAARELDRQVNSLLYDRLAKSRDKKGLMRLSTKGHEVQQPIDVLKEPLVLEFLGLPESPRLVESTLEQALIGNLQKFLLELGKGFAFVARQERITLDADHFYIDLVFYHAVLKCYVLIDLKVGKLTHGDLGQMQFYVNYFDRERCTPGDNPTLGLILCPDKNDAVVKYTLGEQLKRNIFASRYQLHLPTEEELQLELQREWRQFESATQPASSTTSSSRAKRLLQPEKKKR